MQSQNKEYLRHRSKLSPAHQALADLAAKVSRTAPPTKDHTQPPKPGTHAAFKTPPKQQN
jgi:hypothetical protein